MTLSEIHIPAGQQQPPRQPLDESSAPSFSNDVVPVLTRFGCNAGTCHGKLAGQNGFKLFLRGFAPADDFESIVRESLGRRINMESPADSLLIGKAVGTVPHGGGKRFEVNSPAQKILIDWVLAGAKGPTDEDPAIARIEVEPTQETLSIHDSRTLKVTAVFENGDRRDVTWLTQFASSDAGILNVTEGGSVTAIRADDRRKLRRSESCPQQKFCFWATASRCMARPRVSAGTETGGWPPALSRRTMCVC